MTHAIVSTVALFCTHAIVSKIALYMLMQWWALMLFVYSCNEHYCSLCTHAMSTIALCVLMQWARLLFVYSCNSERDCSFINFEGKFLFFWLYINKNVLHIKLWIIRLRIELFDFRTVRTISREPLFVLKLWEPSVENPCLF